VNSFPAIDSPDPAQRRRARRDRYCQRDLVALAVSLLIHALILSLDVGEPGLGLPGLAVPWAERRARAPDLTVRLVPPPAAAPAPALHEPPPRARAPRSDATFTAVAPAPKRAAPDRDTKRPARATPRKPVPATKPKPPVLALEEPRPDTFRVPAPVPPAPVPPPVETFGSLPFEEPIASVESEMAEGEEDVANVEAAQLAEEARHKEEARKRAEAEARKRAEEEALQSALALEEERKAREQAEAAALVQEKSLEAERAAEAARREAEERERALALERQREAERIAEAQRLEEEAARRRMEIERQKEEEARRITLEAEARKRAEEEAKALAEARRKALEAQRQAEEAAAQAERERAEAAAAERARLAAEQAAEGSGRGKPSDAPPAPGALSGLDLRARAIEQARSPGVVPPPPSPPPPPPGGGRRLSALGVDRDVVVRMYAESWRMKIERNGPFNFRRSAALRAPEDPVVTVAIRSDGSLESVHIHHSSGLRELDNAVRRIAEFYAPYSRFPPALARLYDVIEIRRVWQFDGTLRIVEEISP